MRLLSFTKCFRSKLSCRSLVSAGAISQRLARAEQQGLVERLPVDTGDRRGVTVTLTESGHALIERTVDGLLREEEALLAAVTPQQRDHLADLLRTLLAGVSNAVAPRATGRLGR
jgi:DNA-binding MarR family transcriptional regulator